MSELWRIQSLRVTNDRKEFNPSDIFYALSDLHALTEVVRDRIQGMDYPSENKPVCNELNALASLVRIISDDVAMITTAAEIFDYEGRWKDTHAAEQEQDETPSALDALLDRYRLAGIVLGNKIGLLPRQDHDEELRAKEAAELAIVKYPCRTLSDVRAKARLALEDENLFDSIVNCQIDGEHEGKMFLRSLLGEE